MRVELQHSLGRANHCEDLLGRVNLACKPFHSEIGLPNSRLSKCASRVVPTWRHQCSYTDLHVRSNGTTNSEPRHEQSRHMSHVLSLGRKNVALEDADNTTSGISATQVVRVELEHGGFPWGKWIPHGWFHSTKWNLPWRIHYAERMPLYAVRYGMQGSAFLGTSTANTTPHALHGTTPHPTRTSCIAWCGIMRPNLEFLVVPGREGNKGVVVLPGREGNKRGF